MFPVDISRKGAALWHVSVPKIHEYSKIINKWCEICTSFLNVFLSLYTIVCVHDLCQFFWVCIYSFESNSTEVWASSILNFVIIVLRYDDYPQSTARNFTIEGKTSEITVYCVTCMLYDGSDQFFQKLIKWLGVSVSLM